MATPFSKILAAQPSADMAAVLNRVPFRLPAESNSNWKARERWLRRTFGGDVLRFAKPLSAPMPVA